MSLCCLGLALPGWAAELNCADAEFSPDVLALTPELPALCVAIAEKDGRTFAIVNAEVAQPFASDSFAVCFRLPNGTRTLPHLFRAAPESRVRASSGGASVRELAVGQNLAMLIDIASPEIALEPASPDAPLALQPLQPPVPPPAYARSAPSGFLLIGLLVLLLGGVVAALRIRRALRSV